MIKILFSVYETDLSDGGRKVNDCSRGASGSWSDNKFNDESDGQCYVSADHKRKNETNLSSAPCGQKQSGQYAQNTVTRDNLNLQKIFSTSMIKNVIIYLNIYCTIRVILELEKQNLYSEALIVCQ